MHKSFRTYQLAIEFHRSVRSLSLPVYLKSQLLRASSSCVLNLAEGSAKSSPADRRRFYEIALGSHRECRAVLDLADKIPAASAEIADHLGASLYRLVKAVAR
jgi:four helix bundle protein